MIHLIITTWLIELIIWKYLVMIITIPKIYEKMQEYKWDVEWGVTWGLFHKFLKEIYD